MATASRKSVRQAPRSGAIEAAPVPDPAATVPSAELRRDILVLMGSLLLHRGDGDAAMERFAEAITLAEEQGDARALADAHTRMGRLFRYRNEPETASDHYERAVAQAERAKHPGLAAQAWWEWAVLAHFAGDRVTALQRLESAAQRWTEAGSDTDVARTLALMATLHRKEGALPKARRLYEEAVAKQRALCDHYELGITLGGLALLQLAEGEREEGLRTLVEGQQLLRGVNAEAESKLLRTAAEPLLVQE